MYAQHMHEPLALRDHETAAVPIAGQPYEEQYSP
jgi:hypothetical protein